MPQHVHVCFVCGTTFYGRETAKTCSPKCRKKMERERKGETEEQRSRADQRHKAATSRAVPVTDEGKPLDAISAAAPVTDEAVWLDAIDPPPSCASEPAQPFGAPASQIDPKQLARYKALRNLYFKLREREGRRKSRDLDEADDFIKRASRYIGKEDEIAARRYLDIAEKCLKDVEAAQEARVNAYLEKEARRKAAQQASAPAVTDEAVQEEQGSAPRFAGEQGHAVSQIDQEEASAAPASQMRQGWGEYLPGEITHIYAECHRLRSWRLKLSKQGASRNLSVADRLITEVDRGVRSMSPDEARRKLQTAEELLNIVQGVRDAAAAKRDQRSSAPKLASSPPAVTDEAVQEEQGSAPRFAGEQGHAVSQIDQEQASTGRADQLSQEEQGHAPRFAGEQGHAASQIDQERPSAERAEQLSQEEQGSAAPVTDEAIQEERGHAPRFAGEQGHAVSQIDQEQPSAGRADQLSQEEQGHAPRFAGEQEEQGSAAPVTDEAVQEERASEGSPSPDQVRAASQMTRLTERLARWSAHRWAWHIIDRVQAAAEMKHEAAQKMKAKRWDFAMADLAMAFRYLDEAEALLIEQAQAAAPVSQIERPPAAPSAPPTSAPAVSQIEPPPAAPSAAPAALVTDEPIQEEQASAAPVTDDIEQLAASLSPAEINRMLSPAPRLPRPARAGVQPQRAPASWGGGVEEQSERERRQEAALKEARQRRRAWLEGPDYQPSAPSAWERKNITELRIAIELATPKAPNETMRRLLKIAAQRAQHAEQGRSYGERFDWMERASRLFGQANRRIVRMKESRHEKATE